MVWQCAFVWFLFEHYQQYQPTPRANQTRPSYKDRACTIDGSFLDPCRNSSIVSLPSPFCMSTQAYRNHMNQETRTRGIWANQDNTRSIVAKIFSTRFAGVFSSSDNLTIDPCNTEIHVNKRLCCVPCCIIPPSGRWHRQCGTSRRV